MDRQILASPRSLKRVSTFASQVWGPQSFQRRSRSSSSTASLDTTEIKQDNPPPSPSQKLIPPLSVMPTSILLRTLMVTYILSSPRIVNFSIPIMHRISHSKSWFLNPDRNPLLHSIVRKSFYDHFCAGENEKEVKQTIATIKKMGFEGVILGYAKETIVKQGVKGSEEVEVGSAKTTARERVIQEWTEGTLLTLRMLGPGDFLAVKLTGAGPTATEALERGESPPPLVQEAITAICDQAAAQGTRLWIDAEQQVFQHTIDTWTIDLMRKYNQNGKALVYNTCQAYLKGTPKNIARHLELAQKEGWTLGIKLVRGAYIAIEQRDLIHDTIEDTHAAYNGIVQNLLSRQFPGISTTKKEFPNMQLFLASHNSESVSRGYSTWKDRKEKGLPTIKLKIGQLQGMADEVSCELVQMRKQMEEKGEEDWPKAFKCLCWGRTQETVQFLVRRVTENRGSLERTRDWMGGLKREVWRRVKGSVGLDQ